VNHKRHHKKRYAPPGVDYCDGCYGERQERAQTEKTHGKYCRCSCHDVRLEIK
jgi:hypothetical protein